jgi:acyl phosphate:glycerol-3-phosphate acyltransferase
MLISALFLIIAYLIGAIPTAVWYGRRFFKTDIREHGSGNAGASNVFRTFGKKAGIIVMAIDILKGVLATSLPHVLVKNGIIDVSDLAIYQLVFGLIAVVGHVFPIYVGFKGGKGVATMMGVMIALVPMISLLCFGVFIVFLVLSKYTSLGSMMAAVCFPIAIFFTEKPAIYLWFSIVCAAFIIYKHRSNIKRILDGTENRLEWNKKKQ